MSKNIISSLVLLLGGMIISGAASAVPCTSYATVLDWSNGGGVCEDPLDGDMQFTLLGYSIPDSTTIDVTEAELGGIDYYDLGLGWSTDYLGGGSISYAMSSIGSPAENLRSVNFDTIKTGVGTTATKDLYDLSGGAISGPSFLTLTSTDGSDTGYVPFMPRSSIGVIDSFALSSTGAFRDAHNSYAVGVPEPLSLSLLGIGLVGMGLSRRRTRAA